MKLGKMLKQYVAAVLCFALLITSNLASLGNALQGPVDGGNEDIDGRSVTVSFWMDVEEQDRIQVASPSVCSFDGQGEAFVSRPQLYDQWKGYQISQTYMWEKGGDPFYFRDDPDPTPITTDMAKESEYCFDIALELKLIDYQITYDLAGGQYPEGGENPESYTIETATFTLKEPVREGYTFAGWTYQGQDEPVKTVTISKGSTENRSYTANWTPVPKPDPKASYQVFHKKQNIAGDGYETAETENLTGKAGTQVTPEVKSYDGFTAPEVKTVTIAADGTTAVEYLYERNSYQISYDMNGHGTQIDPLTARYEAPVSAPEAPAAEDYTFGGWYRDQECTNAYTFTCMPLGDITVYAHWTPVGSSSLPAKDGWYRGNTSKADITSIVITQKASAAPAAYKERWDASAKQDGSVMVYVEDDGKLTMVSNGARIKLPETACNCFRGFTKVTEITGLSNLDSSSAEDFSAMFAKDEKLKKLDLSSWDLSAAQTLGYMFYGDASLTEVKFPQKKSGAAKGTLTSLRSLFYDCSSLTEENIIALDTSGVTDMRNLLYGCASLKVVDFTDLDTSSVIDMAGMFCGCSSMVYCQLGGDTSSVQDMSYMFAGTSALFGVSLPDGADMSSVRNMSCMFLNAGAKEIYLSETCEYSAVEDTSFMFYGCSNLEQINSGFDLYTTSNTTITKDTNMFAKCVNLKGKLGTTYTSTHAGKQYARVDTKMRMGYFSQDFH